MSKGKHSKQGKHKEEEVLTVKDVRKAAKTLRSKKGKDSVKFIEMENVHIGTDPLEVIPTINEGKAGKDVVPIISNKELELIDEIIKGLPNKVASRNAEDDAYNRAIDDVIESISKVGQRLLKR